MKSLIIYIISFVIGFNSPNSNEINGEFLYEIDISSNELYIINNKLELNTYSLENGNLISSTQLSPPKDSEVNNKFWKGFYRSSFSLNKEVINGLMGDLKFKKFKTNGFKLFHSGGGLIVDISVKDKSFLRLDNSFPFMNKFFGDIVEFNNKIYHFGGYGLFRTNNALLLFDEGNSNQWDEVTYKNDIPIEIKDGIASFSSLLIDSNYYIVGGNSSFNNKQFFNQTILKFDFKTYNWEKLGNINIDISKNPVIIPYETCFYIFEKNYFYQIKMLDQKLIRYDYNKDFNYQQIGHSYPYSNRNRTFISANKKGQELEGLNMHELDDKYVHTFKPHNAKSNTSILNKYRLDNLIDISTKKEIPLYKIEQSRNQFFIPILIVLVIIIINLLYRGVRKKDEISKSKLYTFEDNELFFLTTKINIDNNGVEIIKMLIEKSNVSSNEIVARLVDNGLSYDYASKVKNKIIESLNEKFEFVTNSSDAFINISKSSKDKRIQILTLLKS